MTRIDCGSIWCRQCYLLTDSLLIGVPVALAVVAGGVWLGWRKRCHS